MESRHRDDHEAVGTVRTERLGYTDFAGQPRPDLLNFFPKLDAGRDHRAASGALARHRRRPLHRDGRRVHQGERHRAAGPGPIRHPDRAPNDQGPLLFNDTYPIKVRSFGEGTVTISWNGNRDRDDATLRYRVYRRIGATGNGELLHERSVTAPFWDLPVMTFTDDTASGNGYSIGYKSTTATTTSPTRDGPLSSRPLGQASTSEAVLESEPDSLWRLGEPAGSKVAIDLVGWRNAAISSSRVTFGAPGATTERHLRAVRRDQQRAQHRDDDSRTTARTS